MILEEHVLLIETDSWVGSEKQKLCVFVVQGVPLPKSVGICSGLSWEKTFGFRVYSSTGLCLVKSNWATKISVLPTKWRANAQ